MNEALLEYIASLIPRDLPDGQRLLDEGRAIGRTIAIPRTPFLERYGYDSYLEYRKDQTRQGKIVWQLLVGLSTLEEEIEAVRELDAFSNRTGLDIRTLQSIPSSLVGLPPDRWANAPKPTSYTMRGADEWAAHAKAAPVTVIWQDWHLSSPNNLLTTQYALAAGTPRLGTFSQLIWDYPGWDDEVGRFSDMVRSLGILSAKRDDYITADSYPEDGLPGHFIDAVSYVGYMMLEHYIIEDLCNTRMSISFGGLLTDMQPRMAFAMAMHKLYGSYDEPILSYYNGGTTDQWDHDIEANYGISVPEMMMQVLVELKYKMHTSISPVSITERLRVPTLPELFNIAAAGRRAEEKAHKWLDVIDFGPLETLRDELIEKGGRFYRNVMDAFTAAGVNVNDPLEMILMIKRFNPVRFEQSFHPSVEEFGEFQPYYPNFIGRNTLAISREKKQSLIDLGFGRRLAGRKVVVASGDGHSYGLMYVDKVLRGVGLDAVNGGVDLAPADLLDLADEEETPFIFVSLHCGQVLDYCRQALDLAERRGRRYHIFVGGMLNAMVPGYTEPIDVADRLAEMGVYPSNDLEVSLRTMETLPASPAG